MNVCNCLMCLAEGDNSPHRLRAVIASSGFERPQADEIERLGWVCRNPTNCNYSYCGCWAGNIAVPPRSLKE